MSDEKWIVVHNWEKFQHYSERVPVWIKVYTELLDNDDYRNLPDGTARLLFEVWLAYARTRGQLIFSASHLSRHVGHRVSTQQLERLNHAGFIEVVASKPLALSLARARSREERREENKDLARTRAKSKPSNSKSKPHPPSKVDEDPPPNPEAVERILRMLAGAEPKDVES